MYAYDVDGVLAAAHGDDVVTRAAEQSAVSCTFSTWYLLGGLSTPSGVFPSV